MAASGGPRWKKRAHRPAERRAAVNASARVRVMGAPIPLKASKEWMNRLINFKLQILDDKGTALSEGQGTRLLGDRLNVVLSIKDSLKAEGKKLNKGDLLSLGSVTKMLPTAPNTSLRDHYIDQIRRDLLMSL